MDDIGALALVRCQVRIEQQAGHADDAVHRRTDLVGHIGQEGTLGPVGCFCGFLGLPQSLRLVGEPPVDVTEEEVEEDHYHKSDSTAGQRHTCNCPDKAGGIRRDVPHDHNVAHLATAGVLQFMKGCAVVEFVHCNGHVTGLVLVVALVKMRHNDFRNGLQRLIDDHRCRILIPVSLAA